MSFFDALRVYSECIRYKGNQDISDNDYHFLLTPQTNKNEDKN